MTIKVFGSMLSHQSIRVLLCLAEKDIDFELINVELAVGEHKQPHILARNPFGQVPAFEDDHVKLFESRAISQYIEQTYVGNGKELINKDPKKAAVESVWMHVEVTKFDPVIVALAWELCIKPIIFKIEGNKEIVDKEQKVLESLLDVYETRLTESMYLGGDNFSLADLYHIAVIKFLMDTEMKKVFESRPHVSAWVADLLFRPATIKIFGVTVY
ncbi:glutathione S-transferase APIC-like [Rutidosis leptorrhynchoides]|uniref:glutathione S-transferase APIC-like n=1 Tax=Rutidosis leptorrhynchoides TaxID=125765 RepID=UPI003A9932A7